MQRTLSFQEPSDPVSLALRNGRQNLVGGIHVTAQNSGLVFNHDERQGKAKDVHVLVRYVDSVMRRKVAQEVHVSGIRISMIPC